MRPSADLSLHYRVLLAGVLDEIWISRLYQAQVRYELSPEGDTLTELSGEIPDDSALLGILNIVHDLGLSIRLVEVEAV